MSKTTDFLEQNNNIIVTQADKGKATVIMEKNDYIQRIAIHLADKNTYQELNNTCINSYKQINIKLLNWFQTNGYMSQEEKMTTIRNETKIANFYVMIKTHKEDKPVRPICTRSTHQICNNRKSNNRRSI